MRILSKLFEEVMVEHLTLEEIKALAAFYASPVCKSAAEKIEVLIPEMMTKVEAEIKEMQKKRGGSSGAGSKLTHHSARLSNPKLSKNSPARLSRSKA